MVLAAWAGIAAVALGAEAKPAPFDPTGQYDVRQIEQWRVLVNRRFLNEQPELADQTLALLQHHLYQIGRMVPTPAVEKLRNVTAWVEEAEPHHPCMAYHPDAGWLRAHDMNPEKAGCVEVANARNFLTWTRQQPWMVFHELAHAYHDRFLDRGFNNPEVRHAYDRMIESKRYDAVLHIGGRTEKAYATRDPMEYFAETSECFFGTNDFYPFVRIELNQHDPEMHRLLEKLWETR